MAEAVLLRITGTIELDRAPDDAARGVLTRPKQIALLAILACAADRYVRRDTLLPLLWAELDQERGRAALRKAVFAIRKALGSDSVLNRGSEEIGLGPVLDCDIVRFHAAFSAGDMDAALRAWGGELLPGFHLVDEPEFERWLDQERERLRTSARTALLSVLRRTQLAGNAREVAECAERCLRLQPHDEGLVRTCMEALRDAGDLTSALRAYERFRVRIARDLEMVPAASTETLAESIRELAARATDGGTRQPVAAELPNSGDNRGENDAARNPTAPVATSRWRGVGRLLAGMAAVLLLILTGTWWLEGHSFRSDSSKLPTLAVAGVASYLPQDSASAAALTDMLATSLARVPGLPVHSTLRLYEAAGGSVEPAQLARAARRIGADQILEGGLHRAPNGGVQLSLRLVDPKTGTVVGSYRVEAATPMDAVSRATVQIATSFGLPIPAASFASATTSSMRAYELYEQGLRAWYRVDINGARELFRGAVALDSSFAMATWMLANTLAWQPDWIPTFDRAVRLSERATERERLMIRASYLAAMEDPARRGVAAQLAERYPHEPMGHRLVAEALIAEGRPLDAIPHLRTVIGLDSLSLVELTPGCHACEAFWHLGAAYFGADSVDAGLRAWQQWARATPSSAAPWSWLAYAYESRGRYREAEDALRRMEQLEPGFGSFEIRLAGQRLHANRLEAADSLLMKRLRFGPAEERADIFWNLVLLRNNQGRYREALAFADSFRLAGPKDQHTARAYVRGIALMHAGAGGAAAALFDSTASHPVNYTLRARLGRDMAMNRTNYADAIAIAPAAGTRDRLRALEDSVRAWGALSGYERDRIMHHHVRGLRLRIEGNLEEAAAAFRRASFGPRSSGYARTNIELARVLLAANRAEEALQPLRLNLETHIGADQTWSLRTEARELLGTAHLRLGNRDSARVHFAAVLDAWRNADPQLHGRRSTVEINLRSLMDN